jgi:hypothetical protein
MSKIDPIVAGILGGVLVVIALIFGVVWGANYVNGIYYATANKCIESGGQWLPMGPSASNGFCIKNGKQ